MKNKLTERKLKPNIGLTRHLISGLLCLAVIGLICARASAQNLFVSGSDASGDKIFEFTPDGVQSTFASGLSNPIGLAFDRAGNLFVGDGDAIYKFTPEGVRSTFASGLSSPYPIGCDNTGNLFVVDGSGSILKFTPNGVRTTFAPDVTGWLAVDGAGNLFVATSEFHSPWPAPSTYTIYKYTPGGVRSTFASGDLAAPGGGRGSGYLVSVAGLGVDQAGNLYLVNGGRFYDGGDSAIYKFTPEGNRSTFFGPTEYWGGCDFGSLAIDSTGNVFVTDDCTGIDKITPAGTRSVFASGVEGPLAFQPPQAPTPTLVNISARGSVETGDNALIAGFIVTGSDPEQVITRGLGPSLTNFGVSDALQDPDVELHNSTSMMTHNDDWPNASTANQVPMSYRPADIRESAFMTTLPQGAYTTVLSGKNGMTGNGLLEVYSPGLSNVSTRGFVGTGDRVLIGGFSSSGGNGSLQVVIRALGPTLTQFGVSGALADPTLILVNGNGSVIASNDNWKNTQQSTIQATGFAPPNDLESAIFATLPNGNYTAILAGKNGGTGVGLLDVYKVSVATNK